MIIKPKKLLILCSIFILFFGLILFNNQKQKIPELNNDTSILNPNGYEYYIPHFQDKSSNYFYHQQKTYNSCGPACVQMLIHVIGEEELPSQEILAYEMNTTIEDYTYTNKMHFPFENRNIPVLYNCQFTNQKNALSLLRGNITLNRGIIVLTNYSIGDSYGHYRVIIGYNKTGIFFHDPFFEALYQGPNCYISNEDFEKIWFTYYYPRWAIIVELM